MCRTPMGMSPSNVGHPVVVAAGPGRRRRGIHAARVGVAAIESLECPRSPLRREKARAEVEFQPPQGKAKTKADPLNHFSFGTQVGVKNISASFELTPRSAVFRAESSAWRRRFRLVVIEPGWYIPTQLYYYNGSADATQSFQRGNTADLGVSSKLALIFFTPTWVPNEKWFGGQPSFSLTFGGGWNSTSADLSVSTVNVGTQTLNRSDSDSGGMDLYPQAQIAWTSGNNNWMAYITGDMPVGSYSSTRLSNIGLGHTAIDVGGAYTYLNNTTGFETSWTGGGHLQWDEHEHELPERG